MRTNTGLTIIRGAVDAANDMAAYSCIYVRQAMWQGVHKSAGADKGRVFDSRVHIYIPLSELPAGFTICEGDTVVRGRLNIKTSEQYKQLLQQPDTCRVVEAAKKDYCSPVLRHWSVVCAR